MGYSLHIYVDLTLFSERGKCLTGSSCFCRLFLYSTQFDPKS